MSTVTWRQAVAVIAATVVAFGALVVVVGSDGLPAIDAASSRAVRWFVHQPTGRVVLADGFGGRALASLEVGAPGEEMTVVEGTAGAYLLNDNNAEVRTIDSAELRLGSPQGLATLGTGQAISGVGPAGLIVVDPLGDSANLLQESGDSIAFPVDAATTALVAPDGSVWSIVGGDVLRTSSTASTSRSVSAPSATLTLVGNRAFVVDTTNRRARFADGPWVAIPTDAAPSDIVVQQQGPPNRCGWVGADDELWCISSDGIAEEATVTGLDIQGSDRLAIAGDSAALVRRGPTSIVRFDWRDGDVLEDRRASVSSDATLDVTATVDLVWVDDRAGSFVWAVHPWGITVVDKNDNSVLVLGDEGEVLDEGEGSAGVSGGDDGSDDDVEERDPDDNGLDDPPVAVDDPVTARSGSPVTVPVTANDYDPDGEAITVAAVGRPGHGAVEIGTASTVVYNPDPGYVGLDTFDYTIVDGDGTEASAEVIVELLPADANNQPPVGAADRAQTGPGTAVVVEVLLNDIDPERDPLRIGSFSPPEGIGELTETIGPSGLGALRFEPIDGFEGTAIFSYRPIDSFEAVGEEVDVRVEVASAGDDNRPPLVRPDALRLRRNVEQQLPVLVNDIDPDGDPMTLSVIEPLPAGLEVEVQGELLAIVARAGSAGLVPFEYAVNDGHGHRVRGAVLVDVIDDLEPNRPPVVTPDSETAVVGRPVVLDVTANDVDPDGDPLVVVDVSQPEDDRGDASIVGRNQVEFAPAALVEGESVNARFTYTVSDGNGHEVAGDITITVLPEALPEPPYAQDDSTFTYVDEPVTIDVLRNDGDPSGERPTLVGSPGCAAGGQAVVTADSQVRFDPPPGRSGAFRCTYEVTNSQSLRASASIIVTVREPEINNEPPDAVSDTLSIEIEESALVDVAANDSDPDGPDSELMVVSSTAPTLGTAVREGNRIRFTAGTETGFTSIGYQIADADGAVSLGQLSVIVTGKSNEPPTALPDRRSVEGGAGTAATFDVLANDFDPDDTPGGLSVVSVAQLSKGGDVSLTGDLVTIAPDPGFVGEITAEYTMSDGDGLTDSAQVVLAVLEPLNRPPVAVDDSAEVVNGGSVTASVLFNDSDPDGDPLTMSITGGPDGSLGSASVTGDRAIAFSANPGAAGTANISYEVSDGELTDSAVLRVTVLPCVDSTPIAGDAFLATGYQQPIAVDPADYASNGTLFDVVGPPGYSAGLYTPPPGENGNVTITYAVENSCEQRASGVITIDVNQEPDGQPVTISMGRGEVRDVPVTSLASDDEPLVISGAAGAPGWVRVESGRLVIDTAGVATGVVSWTVTVRDPGGLFTVVPVTVTIVNAPPIAAPDTVDVSGGAAATVDVVANDTDPDGDDGALRVQTAPTSVVFGNGESGTVQLLGNGRRFLVDPGSGVGNASFEYTVVDADGGVSAPATVTVIGPPANTVPFAEDQSVSVITGESTPVVLDAGDADGDALVVVELVDSSGVVTDVTNLTVTVKVPTDGVVTLTYRVDDGDALSRVATVTISATTPPSTTVPPTTTPPTTTPPTTAPPTTAPPTTAPPTTAPPTTVPPTTAPPPTAPPPTAPPPAAPPTTAAGS